MLLYKLLNKLQSLCACLVLLGIITSCASKGLAVKETSVSEPLDGFSGVGLESQDIDKFTKQMTDEILSLNLLSNNFEVPRIIIDSKKLINESSQIINTSLLADRLRIGLLRESRGRLLFISRENSDAVIEEAKITGSLDLFPADYRLVGKITSLSTFSNDTGVKSNFVQVAFELLDLKTSALVWGNFYEVKKVGADDTIYR